MPIASVTRQGLTAIAIGVCLLWACIIGERILISRANAGTEEALREIRLLQIKNRRQPASTPSHPSRPHPELG